MEGLSSMAYFAGIFASFCFTVQYIPQAWHNYKRQSVRGFSAIGIIIKLIGAAFLFSNTFIQGETVAVVMYGLFNVTQHLVFMVQFSSYGSGDIPGDKRFLWWLLFPLVPLLCGIYYPDSIHFTNYFKPIAQVLSHLPQLYECYRIKTTSGVSLTTQHLNVVGGLAGLFMCYIIPPKASTTYLIYSNSILQALSIYMLAAFFGELTIAGKSKHGESSLPT
mmetsp:Transcript_5196/g.5658  ORF Transcript_5196/g.5658 Transcript_5196/m.5658 type:complete len:220 (+) Transcript_5196:20-679(+)